MKKLLLFLAMTLGGCMIQSQAEDTAMGIGVALCTAPNLPVRVTTLGTTGEGGTYLVALSCGDRLPVMMACKDWRCRVADAQLRAQPSVDKEKK